MCHKLQVASPILYAAVVLPRYFVRREAVGLVTCRMYSPKGAKRVAASWLYREIAPEG
jgi:hypothetical protein